MQAEISDILEVIGSYEQFSPYFVDRKVRSHLIRLGSLGCSLCLSFQCRLG